MNRHRPCALRKMDALRKMGALTTMLTLAALAACDGSSKVGNVGSDANRPELLSVEIGRMVDVYAYRRIDRTQGDRRLRANRRIELVQSNVMVNAGIESQPLFDAAGQPVATADFEFLPFNKDVGHEELVILWDDSGTTNGSGDSEAQSFAAALAKAQSGLGEVAPSYRGQNTTTRPIPIVPRNAAIKLKFSGQLDAAAAFFAQNPAAIQLLEFKGDPKVVSPADAFRVLPYRVIPTGDSIVLDTTILGGEAAASPNSPGLPVSADSVTANIRIAIPARGTVVPSFYVKEDPVLALNDVDSAGRAAVIRDFRSGNLADGTAGRLREPEAPAIVGSLSMGIKDVDVANNIVTLNKRLQLVPVRGRYPFVDGPLNANGLPLGPLAAPIQRPLQSGDVLTQVVQVETSPGVFQAVTLRAEVLENLEIGTRVTDPAIGQATSPLPGDTGQGELFTEVRVRVASVFADRSQTRDKNGNLVRFQGNSLPLGQDCVLRARYHEEIAFTGSSVVLTDRAWRSLFVRIEPKPTLGTADVQPNSSIAIEFTKPMDLDQVDNTANLLVTSRPVSAETFAQQMTDPKRAITRVVPTRLSDVGGDGTILRLQPPMGFFHAAGQAEAYSVHVRTGTTGVTDLAGNTLNIFDSAANPQGSWSVDFSLAAGAAENKVGWHSWLFEAEDEDGTLPGSVDVFGQFRLQDGRLIGAAGVRFGRSADQQNLATISRINRGECWDAAANVLVLPTLPVDQAGFPHPGNLYWNPRMSDSIAPPFVPQVYEYWQQVPQPVGRVVEPLKPQGSRMQMRYIEDDFSLSYRQPLDFGLDVEQLYWSPFNDETVLYDVFDRFTMSLGHSPRRPDEFWFLFQPPPPAPIECRLACASMNSALSELFSDNVLPGSSLVPVFEDKVYTINPNEAFRTAEAVKYVPFPRFDRTYTWRDSRLITVDASGNILGLGGAQQPTALAPNDDFTANIDSPWIQSTPDVDFVNAGGSTWVLDAADFVGTNQRDHDPIALPLLVDFKVFADDPLNGIVNGNNGFQVAMLGPPSYGFPAAPGGYYDRVGAGCGAARPRWPSTRAQASGGFDLITGNPVLIDPANTLSAQASVVKDAGLGDAVRALFTAPARDGMMNWARADFVRKVSTATFGFFDTLQPQRALLVDPNNVVTAETGTPNLLAVDPNLRITELAVQMDPPQTRQPAGTTVVVEMRGADTFGNAGLLYNPSFSLSGQTASDAFDTRGNLLNANYACEAYRYSTANTAAGAARVTADGLTRYVTEDQLALIRDPATQLLPRYMNLRVVMTNNVDVSPALSPSLRSMSVVYRMLPNQ
ncbi:MAG: hypothetical protein WAT39_15405 [Planctomycetota bacterium]